MSNNDRIISRLKFQLCINELCLAKVESLNHSYMQTATTKIIKRFHSRLVIYMSDIVLGKLSLLCDLRFN